MVQTDWVHDLKVAELKDELKKRGQPVGGKKAELAERLETFIQENEKTPAGDQPTDGSPASAGGEEQKEDGTTGGEGQGREEPMAEDEEAAGGAKDTEEKSEAAPAAVEAQEELAAKEAQPTAAQPGSTAEVEPQEAAAAMEEEEGPAPSSADTPAQPAAETGTQPAALAPAPAVAADVDLDYGEESDGDGGAAPAATPAAAQQAEAEGGKRKREADGSTPLSGRLGAAGSADRPSKVLRGAGGVGRSGGSLTGGVEKGAAPNPEDVPDASEPATRALRIDGFVRPFTERQVRELLSETGQVLALWMPTIKTHCYAVLESKEQAEATRRATYQLQWPVTNPKRLAPRYVSLSEAEAAIGNGAGNPDFRLKRVEEDGEEAAPPQEAAPPSDPKPDSVPDRSQREWNQNRRSPSPPLEGVKDLREMLSRRASGRGAGGGAAAVAIGAAAAAAASAGDRADRDLPPGIGRGERERRPREPRLEERVLTLDDLFKKTANKPCIYWLPLTNAQVEEKKHKAAQAAAAAAAAPAPANGTAAAT